MWGRFRLFLFLAKCAGVRLRVLQRSNRREGRQLNLWMSRRFLKAMRTTRRLRSRGAQDGLLRLTGESVASMCLCSYP